MTKVCEGSNIRGKNQSKVPLVISIRMPMSQGSLHAGRKKAGLLDKMLLKITENLIQGRCRR